MAGDANEAADVFLHDLATGSNVLVSHAAVGPGVAANGSSRSAIPSADGGFVAFTSEAANLVVGSDTQPHSYDAFLYDVSSGQNALLSHRFGQPGPPVAVVQGGQESGIVEYRPRRREHTEEVLLAEGVDAILDADPGIVL